MQRLISQEGEEGIVALMWVPSHVSISDNEKVDQLARLGAEQEAVGLQWRKSLSHACEVVNPSVSRGE